MRTVIEAQNISKMYRLGQLNSGALTQDIQRWWATTRGKEDPFLKIGETNDRATAGTSNIVWSLKDIDFKIEEADTVGIIGKNGAGKSTLLKLLSRVTSPTTGEIKIKGRVASLLEVGTGFHPELTGKENIFLNGAILGMRRSEIKEQLDAIVDFAGVARYLNTPVKRYSSGMFVRLGFAVAAHLRSEILIVDEVLAVGDIEFQKKCLGKMGEINAGEGRTILFVSHNMTSVKSLCKKGILLENGLVSSSGLIDNTLRAYLGAKDDTPNFRKISQRKENFELISYGVRNTGKQFSDPIKRDEEINLEFDYINNTGYTNIYYNIKVKDENGSFLISTSSQHVNGLILEGKGTAKMSFPAGFFNEGQFSFDVRIIQKRDDGYFDYFREGDGLMMQVLPEKRPLGTFLGKEPGVIRHKFDWRRS
jgi:lipopolysaccharide transport system ATP-binding protein